MKFLSRFRMTFIAMLLAIGLVAAGKFLKLNIVNLENLISMDASSIDDVVAGLFLIILGVSVDSAMLRQRLSLEDQRLEVLKATMRTVQDIMNNFLVSVQLFSSECQGLVSTEAEDQLEERIREVSLKLKALGDLKSADTTPMAAGTGIEFQSSEKKFYSHAA